MSLNGPSRHRHFTELHQLSREGVGGGFSLRALEVICVGVAKNRTALMASAEYDEFISQQIAAFWRHPIAAELSGGGKRGTTRIQQSVPFGEQWFNPDAQDD
jgi:hypothetical protein